MLAIIYVRSDSNLKNMGRCLRSSLQLCLKSGEKRSAATTTIDKWPAFRTLFRYLDLLGLELDEVANKDGRPRAPVPDYPDVCWELGQALDAGRKQERLTLRELSEHTGISYSQLSRLTRGQFKGGRHVEVSYFDGHREFDEDTLVSFTHPVLHFLSKLGGFLRDTGKRAF